MKVKHWLSFFVVLSSILLLTACGSNSGSGGDQSAGTGDQTVDEDTGISYVGAATCVGCHEDISWSMEEVANYLSGAHVIHSDHITAQSDAVCLNCHDPLADGSALQTYIDAEDIPEAGLAAVGCENCHGAGGEHYGVGPIPNAIPDYSPCAVCHNEDIADVGHIEHHPFAKSISENFLTSGHFNGRARDSSPCFRCHSDEGYREYIGTTSGLDAEELEAAIGGVQALATVSPIQCRTCHDSHSGELRADETDIYLNGEHPVTQSQEFNLCTSCHQVFLTATYNAELETFEYELDNEATSYHSDDLDRVIIDTHFDNPDTVAIEGYNINAADENACVMCHDPHTAGKMLSIDSLTGAEDYADNDGHDASFGNFAVSYAEGLGDFHSNYLGEAQIHGCAPCHDGTEFVTLTVGGEASTAYGATSPIGCRTCHDLNVPNSEDGENDPAAYAAVREFEEDYVFEFQSGVTVTAEELDVNRICFECHKGRTGSTAVTTDEAEGTQIYSFSYLHYAPSAAILFGNDSQMVPTYADKTYAGQFVHPGGYQFGCVDCHNVHDTNNNQVETNMMTNPEESCAGCHGVGQDYDAVDLQARTEAFSIRLLDTLLPAYEAAYTAELETGLQDLFTALNAAADNADKLNLLAAHIEGRTNYAPTAQLAKASNVWKIFTYEDGSPDGPVHGHGGSWAHNSEFARQVMYDAIEDLEGDLTGLTRP